MMTVRRMEEQDLQAVMDIIRQAQEGLKEQGVDQWQDGYPDEEVFRQDMGKGSAFVLAEEGKVLGTAAFLFDGEPDYDMIYEGEWPDGLPYAAVHRIAVRSDLKRRGGASYLMEAAERMASERGFSSIRMDTHRDNVVMQSFLKKNGFIYCGIIYLSDGEERRAYQRTIVDKGKVI